MSDLAAPPKQAKSMSAIESFWIHRFVPLYRWALRWVRYGYYLRFSILLWCFPLILVALNTPGAARALMSGIITPITPLQYVCVTFFLISGSVVALVLAHVVVINGKERFGDDPPPLLHHLLAEKDPKWEWIAPLLSQLNNLYTFRYFFSNGYTEQVDSAYIWKGVLGGAAFAIVFWYTITALYYLAYRPGPGAVTKTAATVIFPRWFLGLCGPGKKEGDPTKFGDVLECASLPVSLQWVAKGFPTDGYRWLVEVEDGDKKKKEPAQLYEGHFFSLIAVVGFYALYWLLYPITAPVLVPVAAALAAIAYAVGALLILAVVWSAKADAGDPRALRIWKIILTFLVSVFTLAVPLIYRFSDTERFPILASVLILVISAAWTFGALAFLLDRYRVPVLTAFIAVLVLIRLVPGSYEEHYVSYASSPAEVKLPTPGEVLDARLRAEYPDGKLPAQPTVIVVTATGGGIHAAAWTTAVLGQLEQQFQDKFHQHVVLLSTVSGGSVGLFDYLRELDPATRGAGPDWQRMNFASRCSSLEAVGWGLVYYDIPKMVIPYLPTPSSGQDNLQQWPFGKDRTWALRRAMERNMNDPFCKQWAYWAEKHGAGPKRPDDPHIMLPEVLGDQEANPDGGNLTLGKLSAVDSSNLMPAFTMNTTTVEGGTRFLLANYWIPRNTTPDALITKPAHSFLELYGAPLKSAGGGYVDLPLASAAQLSATFPYVSSAATLQVAPADKAVHFVDGGYYDNDGTASAMEFLRYAMEDSKLLNPSPDNNDGANAGKAGAKDASKGNPAQRSLRVLLVEIRNSPDDPANGPLVPEKDQRKPWKLFSQVIAPLNGFWAAGHESTTTRNRNVLGLLEGTYDGRLDLRHFVIDDEATMQKSPPCVPLNAPANDPLNWYLTPCQQQEVDFAALNPDNVKKYQAVQACFADPKSKLCPGANKEERLR